MLGNHKIVCDEWAEVWDLLRPYADEHFWRWSDVVFDPANCYILGRNTIRENWYDITDLATRYPSRIIFCNPAEGSETILLQLNRMMITDHVRDGRIGLLTSGELEPGWNYCKTDCYFSNIVEYTENKTAQARAEAHPVTDRPYDFLFLNGRLRPHRKYLIDSLREKGLLDKALWTNLNSRVEMAWTSVLTTGDSEPIRFLPPQYEIERAIPNLNRGLEQQAQFVKHQLFNNTWGDAIVNEKCYTDTWFSLVTETIYDYPYTFRTEKIWKPILMAHPFVVAANRGYYRDLRAAGFRTFDHLIDESFDQIDCAQTRLNRIVDIVAWITQQGADDFWHKSMDVCKYNQQHLVEYNRQQRNLLPQQLTLYLDQCSKLP